MFKAAHVGLNISIFEATQRATLREAAGPPWQEETRIREQKRRGMRTDTREDCASPSGTLEIWGERGRGHPPSPLWCPGEGAHPCSRSPHSRAGGRRHAGRARAAAGIARSRDASGAGSAAAGGSARPRSARGGGREATGARCCAVKMRQGMQNARVWGSSFSFPPGLLSAAPSSCCLSGDAGGKAARRAPQQSRTHTPNERQEKHRGRGGDQRFRSRSL